MTVEEIERDLAKAEDELDWPQCRGCGCWEYDACWDEDAGPCWWTDDDLCSHCDAGPDGLAAALGGPDEVPTVRD